MTLKTNLHTVQPPLHTIYILFNACHGSPFSTNECKSVLAGQVNELCALLKILKMPHNLSNIPDPGQRAVFVNIPFIN